MELEATLAALAPDLLRLALGLTGDRAEAEDLTQEALTALVRYWRASGPPESPAAFACTVIRRQAVRRGTQRRALAPLEEAPEGPDPAPLPDETTHGRRELDAALRALMGLEAGDREAILLSAAGLGVEEAASVMGISASALKMRVHRARRRLARELERGDGQETGQRLRAL